MTTPVGYLTVQDLVDALGQTAYLAIFDDGGAGNRAAVDATTQVATVLARSWAWVQSWLPDIYKTMPPKTGATGLPQEGDNIPRLLKDAQLQYVVILSYRRHPEYASTYGAQPGGVLMTELKELMQRIQASTQRIASNDNAPEAAPSNVGGFFDVDVPRLFTKSPDGSSNAGDF